MNQDIMFSNVGNRCTPMSDDALFRAAPSIFATAPHESVSERYSFIPTIDVVEGLREIGWFPVDAKQTKVRNKSNLQTTKHMIRFQNPDIDVVGDDGVIPEAILRNAHDRSSSYNFMGGLFRMICSNGLITSEEMFGNINIRHSTKAVDDVIKACFELTERIPNVMGRIEEMKAIELTPDQQGIFAKSALKFVYGCHGQQAGEKVPVAFGQGELITMGRKGIDLDTIHYIPVRPDRVLMAHRTEDTFEGRSLGVGRSLWTTYNVIQENLISGGVKGFSGSGRRMSTKGVVAINQEVKINKALWSMAEYLGDHVAA